MAGKKTAPRGNSRPWHERPHIIDRVKRVWESFQEGLSIPSISKEEHLSYITTWRDVQRGKQLYLAAAAGEIVSITDEAVLRRETIQEVAFIDRDQARRDDASGRAQLLRIVGDQQTAIEELRGLRNKSAEAGAQAVAAITLVQIGDKKPRPITDFSDEELGSLKERLKGNGQTGGDAT